jgi:hypothetical protein
MRRIVTALVLFVTAASLFGCERYALDRQMKELCKKDGGIKVYETVTLPPAEYDAVFNYVVKARTQEEYYGPEYRYVSESKHLVGKEGDAAKGSGELIRHYSAIHKKVDNHLLGESIRYARGGGDFFTFGFQPSGNSCPWMGIDLGQSIFVKGE